MSVSSVYQLPLFAPDKRCPACDTIKPLDAFPVCKRSPSGVASYCKACKNAKWHAAHPQEASARLQERWSIRRLREEGFKRCSRCHEVKTVDAFSVRADRPGHYMPRCRACVNEVQIARTSNSEQRLRNKAKRALIAAGFRRCTICHQARALADFYREGRNSDGHGSRCKHCTDTANKAYVAAHALEQRIYRQWYALAHRDELAESRRRRQPRYHLQRRVIQNRRRARYLEAEGTYTVQDVMALYESQHGLCAYCTHPLTVYDVDHKQPLSRGGSNWASNLCLACVPCNTRKHNQTEAEFRAILASGRYDGIPGKFVRRGPKRKQ